MKQKTKNVIILWSGGLDSTYLVYDCLKKGYNVYPVYIKLLNNTSKTEMELDVIKKISEKMKEMFPNNFNELKITMSINIDYHYHNNYFQQLPIWILGILFSIKDDIDEIYLGYVTGDDAISYLNEIKKIYKSYSPIVSNLPKLLFPLSKTLKLEILNKLPSVLTDLTKTCEIPKKIKNEITNEIEYIECGQCDTCIKKRKYLPNSFKHTDEKINKLIELNSEKIIKNPLITISYDSALNDFNQSIINILAEEEKKMSGFDIIIDRFKKNIEIINELKIELIDDKKNK